MKQTLYFLFCILLLTSCNTNNKNTANNQSAFTQITQSIDTNENKYDTTIITYYYAEKKFDPDYETMTITHFDISLPKYVKSYVKDSILLSFFDDEFDRKEYIDSLRLLDSTEKIMHNYCDFSSYCDSLDYFFYYHRGGAPIWIERDFMCYAADYGGYYGGAHGYWNNSYCVFDLKTGKIFMPTEIFDENKMDELSSLIYYRIHKNTDDYNCLWEDFKPHMENVKFEPQAVTFVYIPYEAACYAQGHVTVRFTVEEILPYLNKDFVIYKYFKAL